ncbi:major intrinsic protein [Lucifera butyrica]|uniref:Major intrinsic protein n=1 Tax=Lucifera butyrica TaxID=1351585 RepID=A0A498RAZ6_9FIRM|nr:MIP/aquaporin family protein [Lucifera butyrica]VBB07303.1 major intrinsic protein [Lucifera butyrica]
MSMVVAEFLGTAVLTSFGCGVCANVNLNKSRANVSVLGGGWITITAGWAFAVMLGAFMSNALGGAGELNPALVLFKVLAGVYTISVALPIMIAELLGAMLGAFLVWLAYLPHWEVTENPGAILGTFTSGAMIKNDMAACLCEIIATTLLFICLASFGSRLVTGTAGMSPGFGNYLAGMLIWALGLSLGGPSGYALNPARDLGPRIIHAVLPIPGKGSSDWGYAWVPIVGPAVAAFVAYGICQATGLI